jgi:hypothetical protein
MLQIDEEKENELLKVLTKVRIAFELCSISILDCYGDRMLDKFTILSDIGGVEY